MKPINENDPLYNSRGIGVWLKLLEHKYDFVDVGQVLAYAVMKPYEVADPGHWFTQRQIDRFYDIIVQLTGNPNIAVEAGRYAASTESLGAFKQNVLGMIHPARAYAMIGKAAENYARSSKYESRPLAANKVEITVTPNPGTKERPYQCQNRIGLLEAINIGLTHKLPRIEHTKCIFDGADSCKYLISWANTTADLLKTIRNVSIPILFFLGLTLSIINPDRALSLYLPLFFFASIAVSYLYLFAAKNELKTGLNVLIDSSDRLLKETQINYNNSLLTNEIRQIISKYTNIKDVIETVVRLFEKRLDYDRGFILLVNEDKTL